jgi:alpha-L-fucosidase
MQFPIDRLAWFEQARFGMFIHWGLYSLMGRGEWAMSRERTPWSEYEPLKDRFTAEHFRPKEWAKIAKDAGMKYMVLTTKHHEGFCLWNSRGCAFNAVNSAARRDLLAEYVDAVREAGLKVGVYYSLGDWHNPDWFAGWKKDIAARERFVSWTHELVRELMTGYGKIDILWYDLPQCYSAAQWRSVELNAMARSHQPHILINNRAMTTEDFATPEQHATASAVGRPWESCMTLNEHWGYCPSDVNYKSPRDVILTLAGIASGGGNLLLNVGPDGTGRIPDASQKILARVGNWLSRNGECIYNTDRSTVNWYLFGPTTQRGNVLYCFLKQYYGHQQAIGGLTNTVLSASLLHNGQPLSFMQNDAQLIVRDLPATSPDDIVTVIKLELDGIPHDDNSSYLGGADIFPVLPV